VPDEGDEEEHGEHRLVKVQDRIAEVNRDRVGEQRDEQPGGHCLRGTPDEGQGDDPGREHRLGDLVQRRRRLGSDENSRHAAHDHAGDRDGERDLGPGTRERISQSGDSGHGR
jgi:hypothetical protein